MEHTKNCFPFLEVLSEEQILEIHNATLEIMSKIGMVIKDDDGLKLLKEAGAIVEDENVKIPEYLLKKALSTAPSRIPMYDRLGNFSMILEQGKTNFGTGSDTIFTLDINSHERRRSVIEDVGNIARLVDALPNLNFVMSMGTPSDVNPEVSYLFGFIEMVKNNTKPIVFTANDIKDMESIYDIACSIAGGKENLRQRPFIILYTEPISPRLFNSESVQKLLFCSEKGIPVAFPPSPNTGGGGPISVAGALALGNAECLTGLVMAQLKNPGSPFIFGSNVAALDMKTAVVSYGAPEWVLASAGTVAMARFYRLPAWGTSGATDSKVVDAQAGMEAMLSVYNSLLTRSQLVHDNGYIESGMTSSMEMILLVDEAIAISKCIVNGIPVNKKTLALDAIRRAKPGRGFLDDNHTLTNWKEMQYMSKRQDRNVYDNWSRLGKKDMFQRLNEEAKEILDRHKVPVLDDAAEKTIEDILNLRK